MPMLTSTPCLVSTILGTRALRAARQGSLPECACTTSGRSSSSVRVNVPRYDQEDLRGSKRYSRPRLRARSRSGPSLETMRIGSIPCAGSPSRRLRTWRSVPPNPAPWMISATRSGFRTDGGVMAA